MRGLSDRETALARRPDGSDAVAELVAEVTDDRSDRSGRARALGKLTGALLGSARRAGTAAVVSGQWLAELVVHSATHLPVRDLATLREHHDGLTGDALAAALVNRATQVTGGVGAAAGVLATADFAAPPALLTAPVQLAAETLAVVMVELKLVAELHVVYGRVPAGSRAQRTSAYVMSWVRRRGIDPLQAGGLDAALGRVARRELRQRIMRRAGRGVGSFAPFLAGAVAGAELNRRETRKLGEKLIGDLRA